MEMTKDLTLTQEYVSLTYKGATYRLAFDAIAVEKANAEINKAEPRPEPPINVANPQHWFRLTSAQLAIVVWSCLDLFHSDVALNDVKRWVGPGSFDAVFQLLFQFTWPDTWERLQQILADKGTTRSQPEGENTPNP